MLKRVFNERRRLVGDQGMIGNMSLAGAGCSEDVSGLWKRSLPDVFKVMLAILVFSVGELDGNGFDDNGTYCWKR